jgi:hypothetical protein
MWHFDYGTEFRDSLVARESVAGGRVTVCHLWRYVARILESYLALCQQPGGLRLQRARPRTYENVAQTGKWSDATTASPSVITSQRSRRAAIRRDAKMKSMRAQGLSDE